MLSQDERESCVRAKNNCTRNVFSIIEQSTDFMELEFNKHNAVRNAIRYEITRMLNLVFKEIGEEQKVRVSFGWNGTPSNSFAGELSTERTNEQRLD